MDWSKILLFGKDLTHSQLLTPLEKKVFENIVGKGESPGNLYFLLFPQFFLLFPTQISTFESLLFLSSANALNLDKPKTLSFGKDLNLLPNHSVFNPFPNDKF